MSISFNEKNVQGAVDRWNAIAWLRPDHAMAALDGTAQRFLHEQLELHIDALQSFGSAPMSVPPIEFHRSLHTVAQRSGALAYRGDVSFLPKEAFEDDTVSPATIAVFRDTSGATGPLLPPLRKRAKEWSERLEQAKSKATYFHGQEFFDQEHRLLEEVVKPFYKLPPEHVLQNPVFRSLWSSASASAHLAEHTMKLHLQWLLRYGGNEASPWEPLLAMFERGAWPMVTNDGTLLVYVPVWREGTLVIDPSDATIKELDRGPSMSWGDDRGSALSRFHYLGLGPLPFVCVRSGTFNPPRELFRLAEEMASRPPMQPPPVGTDLPFLKPPKKS